MIQFQQWAQATDLTGQNKLRAVFTKTVEGDNGVDIPLTVTYSPDQVEQGFTSQTTSPEHKIEFGRALSQAYYSCLKRAA